MRQAIETLDVGDELLWEPLRFVPPGSWAGHMPFAFWLVKTIRPSTFVELGAHSGNSYAAFCQAISSLEIPCHAYAIDTWTGDDHSGSYSEEVFQDLAAFNSAQFASFSTLLRADFKEARPLFANGSVDLLHIDGLHTYEAVKSDFELWLPTLSKRAVVLFHDINVRERDFGVWKLWQELHRTFPSFEFHHSHGLGVLGVGGIQPRPLERLFARNDGAEGQVIRRLFSARGETLTMRAESLSRESSLLAQLETLVALREKERLEAESCIRVLSDDLDDVARELSRITSEAQRYREAAAANEELLRYQAEELRKSQTRVHALPHRRRRHPSVPRLLSAPFETVRGLLTPPRFKPRLAAAERAASDPLASIRSAPLFRKALARSEMQARLSDFLAGSGRLALRTSPHPELSIIIVVFNQAELTFSCLAALASALESGAVAAEVVLLDNGSSDLTPAMLDRVDGVRVIRAPSNLHFLRGANRAVAEAAGDVLLFLNNDTRVQPASLEAAMQTLRSSATIGAVGGRLVLPDGTLQEAGSIIWNDGTCAGYGRGENPDNFEFTFRRDVDYCSGAFLLTPRPIFERLGCFDERYAPAYYEDTDYCVRLWKQGLRVVYEPQAVVHHYESGSAATAAEVTACIAGNRLAFCNAHEEWLSRQFSPSAANLIAARSARASGKRVLFIDDHVPFPTLGSGFPRANDMIRALVRGGAQVTVFPFVSVSALGADRLGETIDPSVEIFNGSAADIEPFFSQRRGLYDAVVVSRPHNMRALLSALGRKRVRTLAPVLAYDAEAVFACRDVLRDSILKGVSAADSNTRIADEITLARDASVVLCASEAEAELFKNHAVPSVTVLGHALDVNPTKAGFDERFDMVFLGAIHEEDSPNADAVRWFAREILPLIRQRLGRAIRLKVVGVNRADSIRALNGGAIELVGPVDDLTPWFESARLFVAPTRFAAGIPHKVHQAAALGVPAVCTPLIARQLGWTDGCDILVGEDPAAFADACTRLYTDPKLWSTIRTRALERCAEDCSPARFQSTIDGLLGAIPRRAHDARPRVTLRAS